MFSQEPFAIYLALRRASSGRNGVRSGLGDLFVIRVAGNIVAPSQVGSASCCGGFGTSWLCTGAFTMRAILATIEALKNPGKSSATFGRSSTGAPSVETADDRSRSHVRRSGTTRRSREHSRLRHHLRNGSELLEGLLRDAVSWSLVRRTRSRPGGWFFEGCSKISLRTAH